MAAKRLLVVSDEMEVGGSQRQITHLLRGLDRTRWQPELLYFRNPSFLIDEVEDLGILVHHLPKEGRLDPGFVLRYASLLREGRYDLVHAFSMTAELWTAVARMLVRHAPRQISSVRGLYLSESPRFWKLKRFVLGRSDAIIANARACAQATSMRTGVPLERFDIVANGVDIPAMLGERQRAALRARIGAPEGRAFGLFVGRLVREKNPACMVRALAGLSPQSRPWMAIAGDGPLRDDLGMMVASTGLTADISFLGERRDATDLMQAADFLVLPSCQEGMSNAVLEAMAVGCPVIASAVGGNRELIEDRRTGLLFANDDHHALGACLRRLATDPAFRERVSAQAQCQVHERHTVPAMVADTTEVYDRVLRGPEPRTTRSGGRLPGRSAMDDRT
ncbi:glycosyltransferase family 4 protein [Lysobacter niastensis]|uniref:Glycosyltransferase family 4 protein n=1 Tax=Lysobacter niastensis TaxID=380629 RepID=A0ABS0B5V4_9GAMM|nr:glycosyltransferase family 4 protein [Lysobacter niastensis]MBF6024311.1 glycosyltransferase family 4 protein [Lysobacter niastensis]